MNYSDLNVTRNFRFQVDNSALFDPPDYLKFEHYFKTLKPITAKCLQLYVRSTVVSCYMIRTMNTIWVIDVDQIWRYSDVNNFFVDTVVKHSSPVLFEQYHKELFKEIGYKNFKLNFIDYSLACVELLIKKHCLNLKRNVNLKNFINNKANYSGIVERHFRTHAINYNRGMLLYFMFSLEDNSLQHIELIQKVTSSYRSYRDLIKEVEKEVFLLTND